MTTTPAVTEEDQAKALTALEWLRVTHADTLSGRRIEEALAAERGKADALRAAMHALAEEWEAEDDWNEMAPSTAAARLRAIAGGQR